MPKLFPINIEVEEAAVGKVFRILNDMPGVAKIKLGTREGHGKTNGASEPHEPRQPRGHFEKTGEERVIELLRQREPRTLDELRQGFVEEGRSAKSISSCMHMMINNDEVRRTADGYRMTKKMKDRLRHRVAARKTRR